MTHAHEKHESLLSASHTSCMSLKIALCLYISTMHKKQVNFSPFHRLLTLQLNKAHTWCKACALWCYNELKLTNEYGQFLELFKMLTTDVCVTFESTKLHTLYFCVMLIIKLLCCCLCVCTMEVSSSSASVRLIFVHFFLYLQMISFNNPQLSGTFLYPWLF